MDIHEAFQRIFLIRWKAVLVCVLLGTAGALLLHAGQQDLYAASTRLTLDSPDPTSQSEAAVIADTAKAIVTSPSRVRDALQDVGISRNPLEMVERHISVEPLGSSGVLELEVTDTDPSTAAGVANALARDLIATRLESRDAPLASALGELDQRIEELREEIDPLSAEIVATGPQVSIELNRERELLVQRQLILEQQRGELIAAEIARPKPAIIDAAAAAALPEPSRRVPDVALGMLLGLILGIGMASLLESLHPTLLGREALSRELQAPVLGEIRRVRHKATLSITANLRTLLRLAAETNRVHSVELIGVGDSVNPRTVAGLLRADGLPELKPVDETNSRSTPSKASGAILLVPPRVRKSALQPAQGLLAISGWPLLGIVICRFRGTLPTSGPRRRDQTGLEVESVA